MVPVNEISMKIQTILKEKKQLHFEQTIYVGKAHFHQVKRRTYKGILFNVLNVQLQNVSQWALWSVVNAGVYI